MHLKQSMLAALAAIAGTILYLTGAQATAPMIKGQAPGYYRMMLGDFEVTALSDGTFPLQAGALLTGTSSPKIKMALARSYLKDPVEMSVNAFLINTGAKLVLIDTGASGLFGPTLGSLVSNLTAAGYQPEQVDEVYITHMHPDHVGGLMAGDKLVFPNAIVRADKHDADFWLSRANLDKAPQDGKGFFQGAMASLNPYIAAGKFRPFDGSTELAPGVRALATRGHTPGHTTYIIESRGERMEVLGDLVHATAVQLPDPSVTIKFDTDPKSAAAQRKKIFADAAKNGHWVAAAHVAFPGIGHIRAEGKGYSWISANYGVVR
jgi:glyoxylase-like metal-dependent hydrolase (beta-lactamase superfamily II)